MRIYLNFLAVFFSCLTGCSDTAHSELNRIKYTVNSDQILCNGETLEIRGVVYVPGYPGYLPWDIETNLDLPAHLNTSIDQDIQNIKAMGANTVRLWGAPASVFEAIRNTGDLHILQTLWINTEQKDLLDPGFFSETTLYFRSVVDRIYKAYRNSSPPVVAYIVGNEISAVSLQSTILSYPENFSFVGNFLSSDSLTAPEYFLINLGDWLKTYIHDTYGDIPLVTYSNDIRTDELIDTPFLDFRSHNAYSYAIPYYLDSPQPGSVSGTLFQGWIEYLKKKFPGVPLLITETGLSVSPNATHVGPPNYGYGGNTESEQVNGLLQNLDDIQKSPSYCAGVVIHEYLDAWWKGGYDDSFSQDPEDIEEWFGLYRLERDSAWYKVVPRASVASITDIWTAAQ